MTVPIHNHTEFSQLDGMSKPRDIAARCKELGFTAAACTDHGLVAGHPEFWKVLSEEGVKPILGIETYQAVENRQYKQRDAFHLLLLAQNNVGLRNLWSLSTAAHRTGFYYNPRTDWELLREFSEGVICTSACRGGLLQQALKPDNRDDLNANRREILMHLPSVDDVLENYLSIYGERFFIEIHTYDSDDQRGVNQELVDLARKRGVPLVYANDAHYARPEQYEMHEGAQCLAMGMTLKQLSQDKKKRDGKVIPAKKQFHPPCLYIMGEPEVRERLSNHLSKSAVDECIENSDLIADFCDVEFPKPRNRIPVFIPDKGYATNREMFGELCVAGFEKKILGFPDGKNIQDYYERFEYEFGVILDANLTDYFLIVRDYVQWAKAHGVMVGPGRGSVGGSLIAFCLGITEVDPLRYGLIFERFYNPGRVGSLPDIDIDFDPDGREKVKRYVVKKYGSDRVADLGTVTRMGPKLAVRDIGRILSVPLPEVNAINKILDTTTDAGLLADWDEIDQVVGDRLLSHKEDHPRLFEWARQLHEHVRTYGVHAAAVIIGDESLDYCFPLRWVASQEKLVSQWDMHVAEEFGYLKSDFLGLRNLKTLMMVNEELKRQGIDQIAFDALQYQEHPEEMWRMLERGLTVGLFQVEEGGMAKQICRDMKPRSIEDLAVMMAMNRPGPLRAVDENGERAYDKYMRGRKGDTIQYLHPFLEKVTNETYGVFLFQEQVINFMVEIGYAPAEADEVRSIMGKKKVEKIDEEWVRFAERATQHMDKRTARSIWRQVESFSKYGFNKSHAIEYAIILLQCLYAKYSYPCEFLLAGIKSVAKDDKARWVEEGVRMGIRVLPPDVNVSGVEPVITKDGAIRFGLSDVKGMGKSHAKWIVEHAPFTSYDQFVEATRLEENKYTLPSGIRKVLVDIGRAKTLYDVGAFDSLERRVVSKTEQLASEEELLGTALSDDSVEVLEKHKDLIESFCNSYASINGSGIYSLAGIIKEVRETKTKQGSPMAFVKLALDPDVVEIAVWVGELSRFRFLLKRRSPVVVKVKKTERGMRLVEASLLT